MAIPYREHEGLVPHMKYFGASPNPVRYCRMGDKQFICLCGNTPQQANKNFFCRTKKGAPLQELLFCKLMKA